jgi:hypothetical protein
MDKRPSKVNLRKAGHIPEVTTFDGSTAPQMGKLEGSPSLDLGFDQRTQREKNIRFAILNANLDELKILAGDVGTKEYREVHEAVLKEIRGDDLAEIDGRSLSLDIIRSEKLLGFLRAEDKQAIARKLTEYWKQDLELGDLSPNLADASWTIAFVENDLLAELEERHRCEIIKRLVMRFDEAGSFWYGVKEKEIGTFVREKGGEPAAAHTFFVFSQNPDFASVMEDGTKNGILGYVKARFADSSAPYSEDLLCNLVGEALQYPKYRMATLDAVANVMRQWASTDKSIATIFNTDAVIKVLDQESPGWREVFAKKGVALKTTREARQADPKKPWHLIKSPLIVAEHPRDYYMRTNYGEIQKSSAYPRLTEIQTGILKGFTQSPAEAIVTDFRRYRNALVLRTIGRDLETSLCLFAEIAKHCSPIGRRIIARRYFKLLSNKISAGKTRVPIRNQKQFNHIRRKMGLLTPEYLMAA